MQNWNLRHLQAQARLFRYATQKTQAFFSKGNRFVHYCSAFAAASIIEKEEVWIRNSRLMNDFSEIEYGTDCLTTALNLPVGAKLRAILTKMSPEAASILDDLTGLLPKINEETYIFSFSEHDSSEDFTGRLSMWRAYSGDQDGVAIVLNNEPFLAGEIDITPVGYLTKQQFFDEFSRVLADLPQIISNLPPNMFKAKLMTALTHAVMCTKHPGFHEEREWRLIYRPEAGAPSPMIREEVSLRGFRETIYKIPLKNRPDLQVTGIEIRDLVNRIIVGPSDRPKELSEKFVKLLASKGIASADKRVIASNIPFRRKILPH